MNAIQLLEGQHREIETLFSEFDQAEDVETKAEAFEAVADKLAIHAAIEEHHFYPAVKEKRTEGLLVESLQEHLSVKQLLADLLETDADHERFDAQMRTLRETVERHVDEEEGELFPRVRMLFTDDRLEAIGQAMSAEQAELEGRGAPRDAIPADLGQVAIVGP